MTDPAVLGTIAAFGSAILAMLGFAWHALHKPLERLEGEIQKLRERTRTAEHNLAQLMPLAPVVQAAAERRIAHLLEEDP